MNQGLHCTARLVAAAMIDSIVLPPPNPASRAYLVRSAHIVKRLPPVRNAPPRPALALLRTCDLPWRASMGTAVGARDLDEICRVVNPLAGRGGAGRAPSSSPRPGPRPRRYAGTRGQPPRPPMQGLTWPRRSALHRPGEAGKA